MNRYILSTILCFFYFVGICQNGERIYLHTDRQCYIAGETIWFKAYLLLQFAPDDEVSNLYVDLLDIKGNILQRKKMPLFSGTAAGNIDLELSVAQGIYFLKAYTKFGLTEENVLLKSIYLFNPSSRQSIIDSSQDFYDCRFFGQADHLTSGLMNTLYFKATGIYNTPTSITGNIIDENKQTILVFKDEGKGIGKLQWTPIVGKTYTAKINFPNGVTKIYALPPVNPNGLVISMIKSEKNISLHILQQGEVYKNRKLNLLGIMGNQVAFNHEFVLAANEYTGMVPIAEFPEGVLHIMVLYADSIVAEAKTFIQRLDNSVLKFKKDVSSEGDINFSLLFPDSISGTFSISVTDYDKEIIPAHNNIFSDLLINQEDSKKATILLPGDLHKQNVTEISVNTIFYKKVQFENPGKESNSSFPDSNYLTIHGKIVDAKTKKPVSKGELIIFFNGKDSSSTILNPIISNDGNFTIKNLIFYDTATFHYEWKGKRPAELVLDAKNPATAKNSFILPFFADISIFNSPENINKSQSIYKQIRDTFGIKTLPSVTVKTKSTTLREQVNQKYATGLFSSSGMSRILDLIHESPPNNGMNILDYIQGKFGDLSVTRIRAGQYSLTSTRTISISGSAAIKLFLNQTEVSTDAILSIPLNEVAMIKYYPPGNARLPGIGAAGVLAIYTKKYEDTQTRSTNFFVHSFKMSGYSTAKDFAEEIQTNKKINLTTLYWNPQVIIDGSGSTYSFKIIEFNSTKRFHIVVEGFTFKGDILFLDTVIE